MGYWYWYNISHMGMVDASVYTNNIKKMGESE